MRPTRSLRPQPTDALRELWAADGLEDELLEGAGLVGHSNTNELATYEHVVLEDA